MTLIRTDCRQIEARPDPETERVTAATAAEYLDVRLRLARLLRAIDRQGTYHLSSCSSVVQYAVRLGVPSADARMLVDLGRALEAPVAPVTPVAPTGDGGPEAGSAAPDVPSPTVEERIRAGTLSAENAAIVGRIVGQPGLARAGEDWIATAETLRTPELRKQVQARIEQAAQGAPSVVPVTVHVTERTRDDFHRARVIASREAAFHLTEGQAFTRVVRFYLDARDEKRRGSGLGVGARRVGPTAESPGDRYIPAAVRRAVLDRSGDRCEVALDCSHGADLRAVCPNDTFLEFAHVHAHADGGDREERNLLRLCHAHHTQFDADCLVLAGWRGEGGIERPVFTNARGDPVDGIARSRPAPGAASRGAGSRADDVGTDAARDSSVIPVDGRHAPPAHRVDRDGAARPGPGANAPQLGGSEPVRRDGPDDPRPTGVLALAISAETIHTAEASYWPEFGDSADGGDSWEVSERPPPAWVLG